MHIEIYVTSNGTNVEDIREVGRRRMLSFSNISEQMVITEIEEIFSSGAGSTKRCEHQTSTKDKIKIKKKNLMAGLQNILRDSN